MKTFNYFNEKSWKKLYLCFKSFYKKYIEKLQVNNEDASIKHKEAMEKWFRKSNQIQKIINKEENIFLFSFQQGSLLKAMEEGDWILFVFFTMRK